jgi:uncharacterized protein (TIGR03382 family)
MTMLPAHRLLAGLAAATVCLAPAGVLASENYRSEVRSVLSLSFTPECTLCHESEEGGYNTVTLPFGLTLRSRGLTGRDTPSLRRALRAVEAEGKDSDGDGTPDVAELRTGGDPNVAPLQPGQTASPDPVAPDYGCSASGAPALLAPLGLLLLASGLRRRTRACALPHPRRGHRLPGGSSAS